MAELAKSLQFSKFFTKDDKVDITRQRIPMDGISDKIGSKPLVLKLN